MTAAGGLGRRPTTHLLAATPATTQWGWFDNAEPPVLRIRSGDTVVMETMMHSHNQIVPGITIEQVKKTRTDYPGRGPHSLTGPVYVEEAEPGDVLRVRINKIVPRAYGVNFNVPGSSANSRRTFPTGRSSSSISTPTRSRRSSRRGSSSRSNPFLVRSPWLAPSRAATRRCRRDASRATSTSGRWARVRRSMCRCSSKARFCGRATRTPCRATARST